MKRIVKNLILTIFLMAVSGLAANAQIEITEAPRCAEANQLAATEILDVLEAHNKIRAEVGLSKLKWNCNLAKVAQEWATRGIAEHREDTFYGENLFGSSDTAISPIFGVERWLTEKDFWDNPTGTCQAGKICTHYTQMVSKMTKEVGCGINRDAKGKWQVFMVCNYDSQNSIGKAY